MVVTPVVSGIYLYASSRARDTRLAGKGPAWEDRKRERKRQEDAVWVCGVHPVWEDDEKMMPILRAHRSRRWGEMGEGWKTPTSDSISTVCFRKQTPQLALQQKEETHPIQR